MNILEAMHFLYNQFTTMYNQLESQTDIYGTSMHTCWVQEKSYKPACRQIFQDAAEEILNATYQPDSKGVLFQLIYT